MRREELPELHYITPIENVPSILTKGILSHNRAARVRHASISSTEVQDRRSRVRVPGERPLHDYANLYINGRNAMLFQRMNDLPSEEADELCVLRVSCDVLDLPGVVIVDRNAAAGARRFAVSPSGLDMIDTSVVFARYWTHPGDPIAQSDHKQRMCAEVLVPHLVDPRLIDGAHVSCQHGLDAIRDCAPSLASNVNDYLFFR